MDDPELARLCHLDLATAVAEMTQLNPGGKVSARDGALLCAAPSDVPVMVNFALRVSPDAPAEGILDAAEAFYGGLGRGFTLLVHEHDTDLAGAAAARGLMLIVTEYPQMVCRRLPAARAGAERVTDPEQAERYWEICRIGYPSIGVEARAFDRFAGATLLEPHVGAFLVPDRDGRYVACAMATLGHGLGSVWWVACEPEHRGRGLAAAATVAATRWALRHGAPAVSLQASSMGAPMYRALGYEDLGNYTLYLKLAARDDPGGD